MMVLVYGSAHAPGEPMTWARRITDSGERLVGLGRRAVRSTVDPGAATTPMRFFLGQAREVGNVVLVPLRWDVLSCCLIGEFRLSPSSPEGTQISLRATYDDDASADEAQHAAVESTAQALVDGISSAFGCCLSAGDGVVAPMTPAG